jgi:hypothetical protein
MRMRAAVRTASGLPGYALMPPAHLLLDLVLKDEQVLLEHGVLACHRVGHQHLGG